MKVITCDNNSIVTERKIYLKSNEYVENQETNTNERRKEK